MGLIQTAAEIWRSYVTNGVPASGNNQPDKTSIIAWGTFLEAMIGAGAPGLAYASLALLSADLAHGANSTAIVYGDATAANNGFYVKSGISGAGSWARIGDLPNSIVRFTVTGGTGNAITATAPEAPLAPGNKLYLLTPTANNSGATTINGVAIKSALGSDLVTGSLVAGSQVLMAWQLDHYQLLISVPVDATGILNDVIAYRDAASGYATAAATSATNAASSASALGNQVHQYDTRALAIAATIPGGVNFVRTLAYDSSFTPNSGALFKRVAAGTAFLDTWPLTGTIAGGSGYTNGTYRGVPLSSSFGIGAVATITVSGGAVTAVDHSCQPGNGYKVGEVCSQVNAFLGGTGSGFTYTIATISTPLASFVNTNDSSRWQYVPDRGCTLWDAFGAKPDYAGTDSGPTNSFAAIQSALFFGARHGGFAIDNGGYAGDRVRGGQGAYFVDNGGSTLPVIVPNCVIMEGCGSTLKFADAWRSDTDLISLGDPNCHQPAFRTRLENMILHFNSGISAAAHAAVVSSNSIQDNAGMRDCQIDGGQRVGISLGDKSVGGIWGGGTSIDFEKITINCTGSNPIIESNLGTTIVNFKTIVTGGPSSGNTLVSGISLTGSGGIYEFDGIHFEQVPTGILVNLTGTATVTVKKATGGPGVTQVVTLQNTNRPGNFSISNSQKNGATHLVTNGQGGSGRDADIDPKDGALFFNP